MSYSANSFKALAGVRLRTTSKYHEQMSFDRVIELVAAASRRGVSDENGVIFYNYIAHSRHSNPYRVIKCRIHNTPNQWLEVVDYPNGAHPGLEEKRYVNPATEDDERLHHDRKNGMVWHVARPKGW